MNDELVPVYRALTVDDAQRLADILDEAGIEAFVDSTDSPMYAATEGPRSRIVHVRAPISEQVREMVSEFEREWHPGVPADEWQREETGLELPNEQQPSDDDINEDDTLGGTGRFQTETTQPEAPEIDNLVTDQSDPPREVPADEAEGLGPDRDLTQQADVERPEVENQNIDELDVSTETDERETGTPSANLRPKPEDREPRGE